MKDERSKKKGKDKRKREKQGIGNKLR